MDIRRSMRIAISSPLYINNNNHRNFVNQTTMSLATSHTFIWIPVQNYIAPQYLPYQYEFSQQPNEIYILEGRQPQCVAAAWNDAIKKAGEIGADYVLLIN